MSIQIQVEQAALGAIAGLALGSPHVGRTQFQRLTGYSPIPTRMSPHASLDSWLIWQKAHLENRKPFLYGQILLESLDDHTDETAFGLFNLRRGYGTPYSGSLDNPLSDGPRAILRSLIWGFLHFGNPQAAYTSAFHDAGIDHAGDGAWIPAALAVALSLSQPGDTAQDFLNRVTAILPAESQLHRITPAISKNIGNPEAAQFFANQFATNFPDINRSHCVATAAFALLGLLHSDQNSEQAMLIAAGCGGQSELSAATAAAIACFLWSPLRPDYITSLDPAFLATHALKHISPPAGIADFARLISESVALPLQGESLPQTQSGDLGEDQESLEQPNANPNSEDAPPPPLGEDSGGGQEPLEQPSTNSDSEDAPPPPLVLDLGGGREQELNDTNASLESDTPLPRVGSGEDQEQVQNITTPELTCTHNTTTTTELAGLIITANYLETPIAAPPVKKLQITIKNPTGETRNIALAITGPEGWQIASRIADCALRPGESVKFPTVIQPPTTTAPDTNLRLRVDNYQLLIPFLQPTQFSVLGPFVNIEGTGFSYEHPPEKNNQKIQSMTQPFSGRSEMGIRWQVQNFPATEFDLEPVFNGGPGVAYLYAHVTWNSSGLLNLQTQFPGGLKIWIDGTLVTSYNDTTPKPFLHASGSSEFTTAGESRILIKIVRGRDPIPPLRLAFYDESGRIITPQEFITDP
ncbi:hypothetical protein CCB80_04490 [Armatimonadetes bacterium Uphvl-Ar1]|nr:hypothetical protein CCB80_04490 [Armatimonadetes bacterium Uphvl-Ar1]